MTAARMTGMVLILIFLAGHAGAQERYVPFVDEGLRDASFKSFRAQLIAAVKRRDVKSLLSTLDPDIMASFGGDVGIEDFKNLWKPARADSELWETLLPVLTNGGNFVPGSNRTEFCGPYSFSAFPDGVDSFEHSVIFGSSVRLRAGPSLKAAIITQLSYNIVTVDWEHSVSDNAETPTYSWYKVATLGGLKGYVSAEYVRSPIDFRACFQKKNGVWKMTAFVSGD